MMSDADKAARRAELLSHSGDNALPLVLPRARLSPEFIDLQADRVARQMLGEHVTSGKPKDTVNLAGRSMKESQRVKGLNYKLSPTGTVAKETPYTPREGDVKVAFPGDQTVSNKVLDEIEGLPIDSVQEGGAYYGLGQKHLPEPEFWKSTEGPAKNVQGKVDRVAEVFEPERVIGSHLAMGPTSNNFAMHFADANLRAVDWSKAKPKNINVFDNIIASGYKDPKTGEMVRFPNWPGLADREAALAAMKEDSNLRKWFNNRMKVPTITEPLGLPNGLDIQYAITEPRLRDMEINMTGLMTGELKPGAMVEAAGNPHNTYSHRILGEAEGPQEVLTPFVIGFPDAAQHIATTKRPSDFTGTIQKVFPHQVVDAQYLDEYNRYRERIKALTGQKDGGKVDIDAADARLEAAMNQRMAKGGEVDIEAADARLAEALSQHMAGGGKAEAVKGVATGFKRLFADRNVLPAVEREANLAKFLEPSKTPMRLYHGTTATEGGKGEEAIRRIKPSKEGALGSGTYLTPKPNFAGEYASEMGGNMLPVHAQVRNPLVIEGTGDPMIEALTKLGVDEERAIRMVERAYDQKGYIGKEVETRARAQGYDGLMQYRNGELNEVVTYNPNAVKSAIGNEGTYDTSVPDLSKADGGKIVKGIAQVGKRLLASGEEAPKVDRLSMSYKDVTKRVPEVADAVEQLFRGEITKAQYNDIVNLYKPVTPYNFVPKPATKDEAIGALRGDTAKSRYGMQAEYEPGTKVGLRLDIPAYTNKGVWVNSIHDQKAKKVAYGATSSVKNAELGISQTQSKKIAQGGEKQPYARVVGDWNPMSDEEAIARAQEYLNHPEWRQIGLDPERHAYFYDRATMQPITAAEEVIQIGPLVLGKNPKYANIDDFEYADGGYATMLPFAGGGKAIKGGLNAIKRVFKTTDGYTFKEMPDGSVTNGDMTWNSAKEFMQDMPHSYQQGDELGQRRAFMDSYGAPSYEKFMEKWSGFMPADDPQAALQRALNEQRSQGTLKYTKGENKVGLQLVPPIEKKADGGGAFKKLDFYGGGGLTTSGGTFTPEDLGVTSDELNAPVISKDRMRQIRANAADLLGEGKEQLAKEGRQLSKPGGKKDFAIRVGSQLLGGGVDFMNLGLQGLDLVQSAIPALSKPETVLDTAGTGSRIPKFKLASDEPFLGSEHFLRKFKEAKLLGENEFPLNELVYNLFVPTAAASALKGGKGALKAIADAPKKRRGGLAAMTR